MSKSLCLRDKIYFWYCILDQMTIHPMDVNVVSTPALKKATRYMARYKSNKFKFVLLSHVRNLFPREYPVLYNMDKQNRKLY